MLDLKELSAFVAVAETQSIARAAERLHRTQSPLSRQMIALETRLELSLFSREGKRLKLTSRGADFLQECRDVLATASRLEARLSQEASGQAGVLRIGYVESAVHAGVLPRALRAWQRKHPGVRTRLEAMRSDRQFEALRCGEIDLAFTHRGPPAGSDLSGALVASEPLRLVFARSHRLVSSKAVTVKDLHAERFVLLPAGPAQAGREAILARCRAAGLEPDIWHEAAEPSLVLALVGAGLGVGILQAGLQRASGRGVAWRALPRAMSMQLEIHAVIPREPSTAARSLWVTCGGLE